MTPAQIRAALGEQLRCLSGGRGDADNALDVTVEQPAPAAVDLEPAVPPAPAKVRQGFARLREAENLARRARAVGTGGISSDHPRRG